ncbi:MAG: NAD(P)H-quinone oxidoreductase [Bacteroidetes bacterium]|nr:NAD(P)H-quinone oxidoreductase [Bacteroidota bacterium]
MKAILYDQPGPAARVLTGEVPEPVPGPFDLLVKVKAFGVNRADIQQRKGIYPPPPGVTAIPGLELSGIVERTGPSVTAFKPGDPVFGLVQGGGYAEFALLDEKMAVRKPEGISYETAAASPEMTLTAWLNLEITGKLKPGQDVLIHAGASGVGAAAIQVAKRKACRVIVTAGSEEKLAFCRSLGADLALNYKTIPSFRDEVKAFTGGKGVHLILDPVGGSYLEQNIGACRQDGKIILIGLMGGQTATINLGHLLVKRITLAGSTLRSQPAEIREMLTRQVEKHLLPEIISGKFKIPVHRVFRFSEISEAQQVMEENRNLGKLVISAE